MAQRNRLPEDLDPYTGAPDEEILGLAPLAVGFLRRNAPFPTGQTPALFRARLLDFCLPEHTLQVVATPLACGLGCGRGLILPDFHFVSVRARGNHWQDLKVAYQQAQTL